MPGTSTSGVNRLRAWGAVLSAALVALVMAPSSAWATTGHPRGTVTVSAVSQTAVQAAKPGPSATPGVPEAVPAAVPQQDTAGVTGSEAGAADVGGSGVSGQAAGTSADLSVESVTAPPAVVPWIVVALLVLVIAGAVRAYGRSPQRAAIRERRAQP